MNGNNVYLGNPSWPRCNETHVASHDGKLGKDGTCEMEQRVIAMGVDFPRS